MFIKDSFNKPGNEVKSFKYGDSEILIEEGEGFFLVLIGEGKDTTSVRREMMRTIKKIERRYGEALSKWFGNMETFEDVELEFANLLKMGEKQR